MKIPFYYAVFQKINEYGGFTTQCRVDRDSHPFIWCEIQYAIYNKTFAVINWKEITEEEYNYFKKVFK